MSTFSIEKDLISNVQTIMSPNQGTSNTQSFYSNPSSSHVTRSASRRANTRSSAQCRSVSPDLIDEIDTNLIENSPPMIPPNKKRTTPKSSTSSKRNLQKSGEKRKSHTPQQQLSSAELLRPVPVISPTNQGEDFIMILCLVS